MFTTMTTTTTMTDNKQTEGEFIMAEEIPLHPFYAKINSTSKQVKTNLNKLFSSKFFLLTGIFNLKKCLIRSVLFFSRIVLDLKRFETQRTKCICQSERQTGLEIKLPSVFNRQRFVSKSQY